MRRDFAHIFLQAFELIFKTIDTKPVHDFLRHMVRHIVVDQAGGPWHCFTFVSTVK